MEKNLQTSLDTLSNVSLPSVGQEWWKLTRKEIFFFLIFNEMTVEIKLKLKCWIPTILRTPFLWFQDIFRRTIIEQTYLPKLWQESLKPVSNILKIWHSVQVFLGCIHERMGSCIKLRIECTPSVLKKYFEIVTTQYLMKEW